jgi:hypothetical protein
MTRFRTACLLLATSILAAAPMARAQTAPLPSRLPADTVFYLYSRGTNSIAPASVNPLARLWNDPGFAPARRLIEQGFLDSVARNPRLARIPQKDLDALLAQPAVFGIRLTEQAASKDQDGKKSAGQGFLVVQAGAKVAAEVRAALVLADPSSASSMRLTPSGFLIFSKDPATLSDLVARYGSSAPAAASSLGTLASYHESLSELPASPTLELFLRVPAISSLQPQARPNFDTGAFLRTLHLERVHLLCGSVDLNAPASLVHFAILGDTTPGSLFDLFGPNTASFPTLAAAPASASYLVNRLDIGAVVSVVVDAFSVAMPPQQAARLKMMAGLLSTAVVPALGGEYASITPHSATESEPLFAMTIHSPAAVELFGSTLAPFLQPAGVQGPIRYYRVAQRTPPPPAKKDDPASATAHPATQPPKTVPSFIALTPNLLLMSHDEPLVRSAAAAVTSATPQPGLAALPRFHTARASMPAQLFAFGYMNLQGIDWRKAFERGAARAARSPKNARTAERAAAFAKWAREGGSAVLARHLRLFVLGGWKDAHGVHWRGDIH